MATAGVCGWHGDGGFLVEGGMTEVYLTDHAGNRIVDDEGRPFAVVMVETELDILRDIRDILLGIREELNLVPTP